MRRLKIEGTNIDIKIKACNECPLATEEGPSGETWHECIIIKSFIPYYTDEIASNCPLPTITKVIKK